MNAPTNAWTLADVGEQRGRTAVVTGANTGIGLELARELAARGATVVLACRDGGRAERAAAAIGGSVEVCPLDLASLASVRAAADRIRGRHPRLDLLINNAGVMMTPLGATADGFELHFGINHLGHFALTGLLLDLLVDTPGSRVVTVSSSANHNPNGALDFDDPHYRRRRYSRTGAYAQSKLANLMFARQLQRHLENMGAQTISVGAEPGVTPTELRRNAPWALRLAVAGVTAAVGQPDVAHGAHIVLRAATDPDTRGGDYYAPDGRPPLRAKGSPIRIAPTATTAEAEQRLWTLSQHETGVTYTTTSQPR